MAYRVDISPSAQSDLEDAYSWIREHSPQHAARWINGLLEAVFSLETMPNRCPSAPESEDIGIDLRQQLYGKRGGVYRILFITRIDVETGEDVVRIMRIVHGARDRMQARDIEVNEADT